MCQDAHVEGSERFGAIVRRLRLAKGLTQLELGNRIGLTEKAVQAWEAAPGKPGIRTEVATVTKLADVLDVPVVVLSRSLGWAPVGELESPDYEAQIWADDRFTIEDRQMLIHAIRLALSVKKAEQT